MMLLSLCACLEALGCGGVCRSGFEPGGPLLEFRACGLDIDGFTARSMADGSWVQRLRAYLADNRLSKFAS